MRLPILTALASVLLAVAPAIPGRAAPATPSAAPLAPSGAVYVTSLPNGADVWIDGGYVGRAPVYVDALGVGRHRIAIIKAGWVTQEVEVTIVAGTPVTESVALTRSAATGTGRVVVHGVPIDTVRIDGGTVVAERNGGVVLSSGRHEVSARLPHGRVTRAFTVYPDMTTEVVLSDQEQPGTRRGASVVAPANEYIPEVAYRVDRGGRIFVQYGGHDVIGHLGTSVFQLDGKTVDYDAVPFVVGERLYLPLALLNRITAENKK